MCNLKGMLCHMMNKLINIDVVTDIMIWLMKKYNYLRVLVMMIISFSLICQANDKALNAFQQGSFEQAIIHWEKNIEELNSFYDVEILIHLSMAHQAMGNYQAAFKYSAQAWSVVENNNNPIQESAVFNQMSDLWLAVGDVEKALQLADDSVAAARQADQPAVLMQALNTLGNVLSVSGYYLDAVAAYQESVQLASQSSVQESVLKALVNEYRVTVDYGTVAEVLKSLEKTRNYLNQFPHQQNKIPYLIAVGTITQILLDEENFADHKSALLQFSYESFQQAIALAEAAENVYSLSMAYGYWAQLYEQEQRYDEAQKLNRKALFFAKQQDFPHVLYLWQWQQGRILKALGDINAAITTYQAAIETLAPIQHSFDVGYRSLPGNFDQQVRAVYYQLADLILQQAANTQNETEKQQRLFTARDIIESAKAAELENYFKDECLVALQSKKTELGKIAEGTAILYPIPLADRLVLLLNIGTTLQQVSLPVEAFEFDETVQLFRIQLQTRPNNRFLYQAQQLYQWLITPIAAQLKAQHIDTLIVVPDGKLRLVPFSALHDGEQFLIEQYAVVTTPGAKLIEPTPLQQHDNQVLLVGLSEAVQDYPPLPSVPKELNEIEKIAGKVDKIINTAFSADSVANALRETEYNIVHIATHGEFSSDPEQTYLLTYDEKIKMDRLKSIIGLGRFRKTPLELLTLSACRTGVGDDKAALGLAGIAIQAGARSAIASLWFVDDEATSLVIADFYHHLLETGLSKAKALQSAQKNLIGQPRYWHPAYWAPFLLIGN